MFIVFDKYSGNKMGTFFKFYDMNLSIFCTISFWLVGNKWEYTFKVVDTFLCPNLSLMNKGVIPKFINKLALDNEYKKLTNDNLINIFLKTR